MDEIRALIGRLSELTDEELANARQAVLDEFRKADAEESSPENTAMLAELADAAETVMGEQSTRAEAQAEAEQGREAARARIAALEGDAQEEEDGEPEEAVAEQEEQPQAEAEETDDDEERVTREAEAPAEVAVTASAVGTLARRKPQTSPEALVASSRPRAVVMPAGGARVRDFSKPFESREELARTMADTLQSMPVNGPPRGNVLVASATWNYPEERQLGSDVWENERKLDAVLSPPALTASGGICAPVNVDYSVPTWASADRPIRDGLAAFQATRGGITFVKPPDINTYEGATSLWTEATDAAPGEATKPVVRVECGEVVTVYVNAIPTRLQFGNMMGRFAPEQIAANIDVAMAFAARFAENELLKLIAEKCVKEVTNAEVVLGATRDLLVMVDQAVAQQRQLHRLADNQVFTAIFPRWVKDLVRADIAREIGHGEASGRDQLGVTDAEVEGFLRAHGVNPIFHLDGNSSEGGTTQLFAAPVKGAVKAFPKKVVWYCYPEGMFQFLDGGRLDLGVVRDSTLDATNDYETFIEPFEGVAYRGYSNGALQLVTELCANGGTAGTISTAAKCV